MTRTRRELRRDEVDRMVEAQDADQASRRDEKIARFTVLERAKPQMQDDLDDLWDNVPL